jgi:hypothetical protein
MYDIGLLIGDGEQAAVGGAVFERLNPMTDAVATRAAAATVADVNAACDAAQAAFPAWAATGPNARRGLLLKAADALAAKGDALVAAMKAETGSTEGWARFNVALAAGVLREAAALTTQITGETIPSDKPGCIAMAFRQAAGVCVGIAPWNAPGVRQHRGAEDVGILSPDALPDRRGAARRRLPHRRRQRHLECARRRPRDRERPDRSSRRAPRQLHRLDPRRQAHR